MQDIHMQERVVKIPFETAAHEKAFVPRRKDRNAVNSQIPKPFILQTIREKNKKNNNHLQRLNLPGEVLSLLRGQVFFLFVLSSQDGDEAVGLLLQPLDLSNNVLRKNIFW